MKSIKDWTVLDSGATSHFLVTAASITNITPASNPHTVKLPDGACVSSTHKCTLTLPQIPTIAREGHIIPGLASHSLVSVVKLCNAGCEVTFTKIDCQVKYLGRIILRCSKCTRTGLWMINITNTAKFTPDISNTQKIQTANTLIQPTTDHIIKNVIPTSSKPILAMYHHQTLDSPPVPIIVKACRNNQLNTFPSLDSTLILGHLPPSIATAKWHMIRPRSSIQSTRNNRSEILDTWLQVDDMNPPQQICNAN